MSNGDVEFAEFLAVAWPRVYRTTFAVAGQHAPTASAVQSSFARAYADWRRVQESEDPESEVTVAAIKAVLKVIRKSPDLGTWQPDKFGPLAPHGNLIGASAEERSRVDDMWARFQALAPQDRAAVAFEAMGSDNGWGHRSSSTSVHGQFVDFLAGRLDEIVIPSADLDTVAAQGSRRRRRRRWVTGAVAATVVAAVAVPMALFVPQDEAASAKNVGVWREVATSPLTPRWASVASWTGQEALFIGGYTDESCTARSICQGVSDGAAYDPEQDSWRTIAPAPFGVAAEPTVQIGDRMFIQGDEGWWFYESSDDEWVQIPDPPLPTGGGVWGGMFAGVRDSFYIVDPFAAGPIQVYDPDSNQWDSLPSSPFEPALERRFLVGTTDGLLVVGAKPTRPPSSPEDGTEFEAELFNGKTWTRFEPSGQKAFLCCWVWTGERMIHLERLPVYGGDKLTDGVRFAGGMTLDLESGDWGYLAEAPADAQGTETWRLWAWSDEGGPLVAINGYVYDDRGPSWARLSRPAQAPEAETASVWADGVLIAFGGANFGAGLDENTGSTSRAWIYTPRDP